MIIALAREGSHFRGGGLDLQWPRGGGHRDSAVFMREPPPAVAAALAKGLLVEITAEANAAMNPHPLKPKPTPPRRRR